MLLNSISKYTLSLEGLFVKKQGTLTWNETSPFTTQLPFQLRLWLLEFFRFYLLSICVVTAVSSIYGPHNLFKITFETAGISHFLNFKRVKQILITTCAMEMCCIVIILRLEGAFLSHSRKNKVLGRNKN